MKQNFKNLTMFFNVVKIRTLLKNVGTITIPEDSRMIQKFIDHIIRHNL
ncbi:hypothetical protein LEP1GSC020_4535 [Leptospira interrogans serovar Grippotyphosa str. 2006006986]|nr:hypothetical protein LEP1GSC045_2125 [Leptospira interrogans serovar Pomona str. Kennewicki LC82-25]EKN98179.1 hypothetical protein LEP1GSC014_1040 [Leptospira interrogans serovar Pomona str. Pomona]EKO88440.1 hypothetical protein LEP1GSC009_0942 [Leptospira interrogans serovar Grippotyphosa str. Andaman]EKP84226.1 hypothetical protein LEP1GSC020_4535 [Leptospira interrogans serovar Grippotyphosa str. 2006006986]EMF31625.1 hypothetical protein LEP1GSC201_3958 [Leptospira interrogans serovar 